MATAGGNKWPYGCSFWVQITYPSVDRTSPGYLVDGWNIICSGSGQGQVATVVLRVAGECRYILQADGDYGTAEIRLRVQ